MCFGLNYVVIGCGYFSIKLNKLYLKQKKNNKTKNTSRFGIGRFTTVAEIDYTADKCIKHVERLREMSPLWEMVQDGIDLKNIKWTQH